MGQGSMASTGYGTRTPEAIHTAFLPSVSPSFSRGPQSPHLPLTFIHLPIFIEHHEFERAPGVGDGRRSLEYCSPWDRKESDATERLN